MLTVYTAITGGFNDLPRAPLITSVRPVRYVLFSDTITKAPEPWELRPPRWEHNTDPRRTARFHKVNAHELFDTGYSLWLDGSHQLAVDPWTIVDCHNTADGKCVWTFRHPQRSCIYDELVACCKLKKDSPAVMKAQIARYRSEKFPAGAGLHETAAVLRRHTSVAAAINQRWWREIVSGSLRDQLSFDYILWKLGYSRYCGLLPGHRTSSPYFVCHKHR